MYCYLRFFSNADVIGVLYKLLTVNTNFAKSIFNKSLSTLNIDILTQKIQRQTEMSNLYLTKDLFHILILISLISKEIICNIFSNFLRQN